MKKDTQYFCNKCKNLIVEWLTTVVIIQPNNSLHFCKKVCYDKYNKTYNPYKNN